ncbi:polyphenol oxidase family protein [Deferribacterales bacterium Es71-Z0220]|uniref:polyphenol oxidase family protein n=1 Tax=Deferrivibrio essentukiensis TaxID=2880922 RepID=UPI001F61FE73|nr:polyphenol oxidase family protein [Deferrivibrio essentukiensis]MCB4204158.1 polyphenol oxidase family protein [Deferrivibrio essentukiensis]
MLIAKQGIMYIKPYGLPENILSITTTRHTGFSKSEYASLNFGFHVDDNPLDVEKNYDKLSTVFKLDKVITLTQIHSNTIINLDNTDNLNSFAGALTGDGLITKKTNLPIGIMTADCFNVQLIGKEYIANLHCGWKSIYLGIIENCLKIFADNEDIVEYAVIGPGICENCYTVGKDLAIKFSDLVREKSIFHIKGDNYLLNLRKIIKLKLENFVNNVIDLNYCTYCSDFLYSYRKSNKTGRMISILMKYE